ncbi:N-methyl-L-tryptophan oxidase [Paenibacillus chitinolyticus]|uniref:N-methyl-L-tryptophan oxidase n=1 Tax=Paenibacillus chitinolyticus TaxID=79263 RepID=UPI0036D96708
MRTRYDVIIIGAGSMGLSAGYQLASSGVRTLLLDAGNPPHEEGSHHGETRLIRHAYGGASAYVPLALRAQKLWEELERLSGETLLRTTGVLNVSREETANHRSKIANAQRYGVPLEELDAADIHRRWPGFSLPEGWSGLYEPDGGVLLSEACLRVYRKLALEAGAELLTDTPVRSVRLDGGEAVVATLAGTFSSGRLIVTAGAAAAGILPGRPLPVTAVRKTVAWFRADSGLYRSPGFPGFTVHTGLGEYYGFPDFDGSGVKVGRHDEGIPLSPGEPKHPFGRTAADEEELRAFMEAYLPGASGALLKGKVCLYERTPDEDFIIGRLPGYPHVSVAAGFSGHGFKFASVVGEILRDLTVNGRSSLDLAPFSPERFN